MKKLFKKLILTLTTFGALVLPAITYAGVRLEDVFGKYRVGGRREFSEVENVANLPDPDVVDFIIQIIQIILRISSILAFLGLTISGIMFILSRGEGDTNMLDKAKKTLTYTVVGIIVIMAAYGIVFGITALRYNTI